MDEGQLCISPFARQKTPKEKSTLDETTDRSGKNQKFTQPSDISHLNV